MACHADFDLPKSARNDDGSVFATDFAPLKCFAYPKRRGTHRQNAKIKSDILENINAKSTYFAKLTNPAKYSKNSAKPADSQQTTKSTYFADFTNPAKTTTKNNKNNKKHIIHKTATSCKTFKKINTFCKIYKQNLAQNPKPKNKKTKNKNPKTLTPQNIIQKHFLSHIYRAEK